MADHRSHYVVLGVAPDESADGIRDAYRDLAKRHHPDVSGEQETRAFQDIAEAYRVLSDPALRREYDDRLQRSALPPRYPAPGRSPPARRGEDIRAATVRFGAAPGRARGGRAVDFDLVLTAQEAARGGVLRAGVPIAVPCAACGQTGRDWLLPCIECDGRGVVERESQIWIDIPPMTPSGSVIDVPVWRTDGTIRVRLHVAIAP
ncbi:MAG TPA: DnaJ domain-containing protein [Anaeromyxobacteraceae bacterium]|nr:DnaJ domain-containing protein [Anaeromyxobacteraceae bacterium]